MGVAASKIKVTHYAEREPRKDEKNVPTACGISIPIKQTTREVAKVTCFLCHQRLNN